MVNSHDIVLSISCYHIIFTLSFSAEQQSYQLQVNNSLYSLNKNGLFLNSNFTSSHFPVLRRYYTLINFGHQPFLLIVDIKSILVMYQ